MGAGPIITGGLSGRIGRNMVDPRRDDHTGAALGIVAVGHSFGVWLARPSCSRSEPPRSTRRFWPPLTTSPTPNGAPGPSGPTDCGATVASPSAGCCHFDAFGIPAAVALVGALTAASKLIVATRMRGTDHLRAALTVKSNAS